MTSLQFVTMEIPCGDKGPESCLPDLLGISNIQNQTRFSLGEEDEIFQGYGQRKNGYPYRIYTEYQRTLKKKQVPAAVLENGHMKAVFLPELGGRLWQLFDKDHGRDLLYVNDVIRGSNLAVRGPWVSGGVEWNLGVIGHTPLTMETLFTARLDSPRGPVLRLYGYERIRQLCYQMDFWLDEDRPGLNCHMAVFNQNDQVVPMYWWSNIASPLYPGGRLFVPAHRAFSQAGGTVHPVSVPMDGTVDVSRYESIPWQRDYFFDLDRGAPRWLAHVDCQGFGLLHSSTDRLQSRKLFVWGNQEGGRHWQEFLTEKAGPYLEVQAGLGKTQYGCIPMSPQTLWQWTERYEPITLQGPVGELDFDETAQRISSEYFPGLALRIAEQRGRAQLREPAQVMIRGSGDAMLRNEERKAQGMEPMAPHLDFEAEDPKVSPWLAYLGQGTFPDFPGDQPPQYDLTGEFFRSRLQKEVSRGQGGWYGPYALALLELERDRQDLALQYIRQSLSLEETAWAQYVLSVLLYQQGDSLGCQAAALRSLELHPESLPHLKLILQVLGLSGNWQAIRDLPLEKYQMEDARVRIYRAKALMVLNENREALALLEEKGFVISPDVRECETDTAELWQILKRRLTDACFVNDLFALVFAKKSATKNRPKSGRREASTQRESRQE